MNQHIPNGIAHFDVAGTDIAALKAFYGATFGWSITDKGPGYSLVETPQGSPNGALAEAETASLTIGIVVPDLAAAIARGEGSGGSVAMPVTDNGWVRKAQLRDPAGNLVTLIQA